MVNIDININDGFVSIHVGAEIAQLQNELNLIDKKSEVGKLLASIIKKSRKAVFLT